MWGEVYEPLVDDQWPHNPHFLSKIAMARKHMWGEVYEPMVDDQWQHNPHFCRK
jgi:hypothetical protein